MREAKGKRNENSSLISLTPRLGATGSTIMLLDREAGYLSSSLGVAVRSFFPLPPLSPVPAI